MVSPILGPQHVRRFGDVVEIRVPSVPNYQLSRPETITVTLPGGDPDVDPLLWTMEGTLTLTLTLPLPLPLTLTPTLPLGADLDERGGRADAAAAVGLPRP